jgi:hypothetical protein
MTLPRSGIAPPASTRATAHWQELTARAPNSEPGADSALRPECGALLQRALGLRLLSPSVAGSFLDERREQLGRYTSPTLLGAALVEAGHLTAYQASRLLAGTLHGLVLGNYRVVDRLGAGGMGVVFVAEHTLMKHRAAVKVLPVDDDCPPSLLERFYAEMRVLAELHHPNIVLGPV